MTAEPRRYDVEVATTARNIRTATVIRPGDHVLLTTTEDHYYGTESLQRVLDGLCAEFPGVQFTIAAGVTDVAVQASDRVQ